MNNNIISNRNNQALSDIILNVASFLGGRVIATFKQEPGIRGFAFNTIALFKELVRHNLFHNDVFPSHAYLAQRLGCDVSTIKRSQKVLVDFGLVNVASGKIKHETNRYTLGNILKNKDMIYYLRDVIPCLRFVMNKIQGIPNISEVCASVKGYPSNKSVQKQNELRINNVLKISIHNTNLCIDTSNTVDDDLENENEKGYKYKKRKIEEWLSKEIFSNVRAIMIADPFISEYEARRISKYGAMSAITNKITKDALLKISTKKQSDEEEARIISNRKNLDADIMKARKTAGPFQARYMDYILKGSIGKF